MRVFNEHAAHVHATNAPRRIAEKHDVAAEAFDGEIFIHRSDVYALGFGDDGVKRIIRNRAAARDGSEAAAAPAAHASVYAIAMEISTVTSAARGDSLGKHFDDCVEL